MKNFEDEDIVTEKDIEFRYVFGTTRKEDGSIDELLYVFRSKSDNTLYWDHEHTELFAKRILDGELIAYSGSFEYKDKKGKLTNVALVTICVTPDSMFVKTASDNAEINNLENLPICELYKKDNVTYYRTKK